MKQLVFGLALGAAVAAGISTGEANAEDVHGAATIYGWLPTISGQNDTPDNFNTDLLPIDISGQSVLEALQFAFFAAGEVRRGRWGLMFDGAYADLNFDADTSFTPPNGAEVNVSGEMGTTLYFASGAVSWRGYEQEGRAVDLYAGIRATGTTVNFGSQIGQFTRDRKVTESWVDPIVGARGIYPFSDRWSVSGRADVGGFSAGSDLTWQALGAVNYGLTDAWQASLGYRYMHIDYQADLLRLNIDLHGPFLGVTYRF